jgi:hypothetical protein
MLNAVSIHLPISKFLLYPYNNGVNQGNINFVILLFNFSILSNLMPILTEVLRGFHQSLQAKDAAILR